MDRQRLPGGSVEMEPEELECMQKLRGVCGVIRNTDLLYFLSLA